MDNNHLSNYLGGGFWQISERTVKVFGIEMALYITNLFDWRMKLRRDNGLEKDGFFYLRQDDIQKRTGLTPDKQRKFISILITPDEKYPKTKNGLGIIEVSKRKAPAQNFYKINSSRLIEYIEEKIQEMSTTTEQIWQNTISGYCETQYVDTVKHNHINNNNSKNNKDKNNDSSKEESNEASPQLPLVKSPSSDKTLNKPILKLNRRTKPTLSPVLLTPKIDRAKMKSDLIKNQPLPEIMKPIIIPNQIQSIIEHWISLGFKETIQTKAPSAYKNNISFTKTLLKKYSIDEINQAITRFSIATFNDNYLPINGKKEEYKKMHLSAFIKSSYRDKTGRLIETSLFQKYLSKEEPKLINPPKENKFPDTVSTYSRRYQAEILGGTSINITVDMINKFITASEKLNEFWDKNKNRYHGRSSLSEVANWHFDAMKKCYNNDFTPGHLCTDNSMQRFAAYLIKERIFDDNTTTNASTMGYADKRRNRQDEERSDWSDIG